MAEEAPDAVEMYRFWGWWRNIKMQVKQFPSSGLSSEKQVNIWCQWRMVVAAFEREPDL